MAHTIRPVSIEDREPIMDIFNHYVENSFAAFPEETLPYPAFDAFLQMSSGYPTGTVTDQYGSVIGFGMLRAHNQLPAFTKAAEVTYFIHPDFTGKGIGKELLCFLEKEGKDKGIATILATISSLNPRSIDFHQKNGFVKCGRFIGVGTKKKRIFDTVWMQKIL